MDHNAGIYLAVGGLVIAWANNESVFLAMLQSVMGGDRDAGNIVWFSQRNTKARIDLLLRLCQAKVHDKALLRDLRSAASRFRGLSRVRNLYCHGLYGYDPQFRLNQIISTTVADDGAPVRHTQKFFNQATLNELSDAIIKLAELNRDLWGLVPRLASELGVSSPPIPQLLPPEGIPRRFVEDTKE